MQDESIIALYWARDEGAIAASADKYGRYCYAISARIVHRHEDAEECVNDTWLAAWNSMPPKQPQALQLFFARIVRNLSFNRYAAVTAEKRGGGEIEAALDELSECLAAGEQVEDAVERRALQAAVNSFLRGIDARDCDIFLRRYFFVETTAEFARR